MKLIDRYLDKWISRKALAQLKHNFALCGYATAIETKSDYYNISIKRYHEKNKKPKYFFTLQATDGLEFYIKWYETELRDFARAAEELLGDEKK